MQCSHHPGIGAAGMCSYSGKPYCADCLVEVEGRMYAKENLGKVMAELKSSGSNQPMVFMNAGGASSSSSSSASSSAAASSGGGLVGVRTSRREKGTAIVLCLCVFLGIGGLHRFYTGHMAAGIIQILTLGGLFIWATVDLLSLLSGSFRDVDGQRVT